MKTRKALFLDRDGVINVERGEYTYRKEDFLFTVGLIPFLKAARSRGYLLIMISNQGGISRGIYRFEELEALHDWMQRELGKEGVALDDIYYCPHHDAVEQCLCRKPQPLMLLKAMAFHDVNPALSLFVGDSARDAEAGRRAGVRVLKIGPNEDLTKYLSLL